MTLLIALADFSMTQREKYWVQHLKKNIRRQTEGRSTLSDLPPPVKSYFEYAIGANDLQPGYVRADQSGYFRFINDQSRFKEDEGWHPLKATQHFSINPTGFYWFARIKVNALLWMRGHDSYDTGKGSMQWRANSLIKLIDAKGEKLDEGSLYRYLAEAVWFPTALLPNNGVIWKAIDDHSAEATLRNANSHATVRFHFNDQHQICKMSAKRYRESNGQYIKSNWFGYYRNYQQKNGFHIPVEGDISWEMPHGEMKYVRIRTDSVVYR